MIEKAIVIFYLSKKQANFATEACPKKKNYNVDKKI